METNRYFKRLFLYVDTKAKAFLLSIDLALAPCPSQARQKENRL
ncbi:hypothetical protein [Psychrobacillus sp. NPDC093180]